MEANNNRLGSSQGGRFPNKPPLPTGAANNGSATS